MLELVEDMQGKHDKIGKRARLWKPVRRCVFPDRCSAGTPFALCRLSVLALCCYAAPQAEHTLSNASLKGDGSSAAPWPAAGRLLLAGAPPTPLAGAPLLAEGPLPLAPERCWKRSRSFNSPERSADLK